MANEAQDERRTAAGREWALNDHESRLDGLDDRVSGLDQRITKIEGKEASRDKLRDLTIRSVITLAGGIIVGIVVALFTTGIHI